MNLQRAMENNAPLMLAGFGVLAFIGATVMGTQAAPIANEALDELPDDATRIEKARTIAPVYAPTVGMLMIGTACIVLSNRMYKQRYMTLLALYSIGQKSLERWQDAIVDEVGPKKAENVRDRVIAPTGDVPTNLVVSDDDILFFDVYSGRYFKFGNVEAIRRIINDLNKQILVEDFVSLNEFYYLLGIPPLQIGDAVGWSSEDEGLADIRLDATLYEDRPVISISFVVEPRKY